jgi:hypothetical protein
MQVVGTDSSSYPCRLFIHSTNQPPALMSEDSAANKLSEVFSSDQKNNNLSLIRLMGRWGRQKKRESMCICAAPHHINPDYGEKKASKTLGLTPSLTQVITWQFNNQLHAAQYLRMWQSLNWNCLPFTSTIEPYLGQLNPVLPSHPVYLTSTVTIYSHLHLSLPNDFLPADLLIKIQNTLLNFPCATRPTHPNICDLFTPTVLCADYKLQCPSECSFLDPPYCLSPIQN